MDPDESRRRGGPRRAPVSRQGRGGPAPRRAAPLRAGGPRRDAPSRRPSRRDRSAPPPAPPQEAYEPYEAEYGPEEPYEAEYASYEPDGMSDETVHDGAFTADDVYAAAPPGPADRARRGGKPGKGGKGGKGGKPGKGGKGGRSGGFGPKLYFGAAAVLGLLMLAGLGLLVLPDDEDAADAGGTTDVRIGRPEGNGVSPTSYSSSPSSEAYAGITSRSADPEPLTIDEAFPAAEATLAVPDSRVRVKLRAKRLDDDCAAAVWGESVGAELARGGCTQAARAIYSEGGRGYALAVAVFNLNEARDADRFVARLEETIGAGFVRPLEADAPLDGFGRGFGMARGLAMGHFAVVSWSQRLDGRGEETDETLLSLLIEGGKSPAVLGRAARTAN